MTSGELSTNTAAAFMHIQEEQSRQRHLQDPGTSRAVLDSSKLDSLRKRHSFLNEYSDGVLASTPIETLLKLESTSIKLQNLERGNNVDEKLAANRDNLESTNIRVMEGVDNRWTTLHPARFLPGAGCSAVKMWLRAREVLDGTKAAAISIYDMASIGLAGYVTPKGGLSYMTLEIPICSSSYSQSTIVARGPAPRRANAETRSFMMWRRLVN